MEIYEIRKIKKTKKTMCFLDWKYFKPFVSIENKFLDYNILGIDFKNRYDSLSPWYWEGLKVKGDEFLGNAKKTYTEMQKLFNFNLKDVIFFGYSLSSLYLLYTMTLNPQYNGKYVLISPSVWFKDFEDYIIQSINNKVIKNQNILLLWSEQEGKNKKVLEQMPEKLQNIYSYLKKDNKIKNKIFPGGHHDYLSEKISYALDNVLKI